MAYTVYIELNSGHRVVLGNDYPEKSDADLHANQIRRLIEEEADPHPNAFSYFDDVNGDRVQIRIGSIAGIFSLSNARFAERADQSGVIW